jgi:hypothetical protein
MTTFSDRKVRSYGIRFNFFFPMLLAGLLAGGCATTPEEKKAKQEKNEVAALRLHLEANEAGKTVSVLRSSPVRLQVESEAFFDERDIKTAKLMDSLGGFSIAIETTPHGRLTLESGSVTRLGRRMAIASTWVTGDGQSTVTRWLAAPVFRQPMRDGYFAFTPDCTREEAAHIVRGLNNVAIKLENQQKPGKKERKDDIQTPPSSAEEAIKAYKEGR